MRVEKNCINCDKKLNLDIHFLNDGDEVSLLSCEQDGLYAVVDTTGDTLEPITTDDYEGGHELGTTSTKLPNGDRVEMKSCKMCGFYAIDDGLPIKK